MKNWANVRLIGSLNFSGNNEHGLDIKIKNGDTGFQKIVQFQETVHIFF